MLDTLKLKTKISLLIAATFVGLAIGIVVDAMNLKDELLEARKLQVRSIVESAVQSAVAQHARIGELGEAQAKERALQAIHGMRYGGSDGKSEYLYIYDKAGTTVMHPFRPEWIGRNVVEEVRDGKGRYTLKDILAIAGSTGAGFVDTSFPRPGTSEAVDKLQYVATFAPWNWVIGTGVYVDDVERQFRESLVKNLSLNLAVMLVVVVLGIQIGRSVLRQIGGEPAEAMRLMDLAASGDLTVAIPNARAGSLLGNLSRMLTAIRQMVGEISTKSGIVRQTAEGISTSSSQVAEASHRQADSTSSMAAAIEELTVSINHISELARDTEQYSSSAAQLAQGGEARVAEAAREMALISEQTSAAAGMIRSLESRANEISKITEVIKEIAAQTNLLALNASIEAARAGEQGRGFAVVADEVRKLAERTAKATMDISAMIDTMLSSSETAMRTTETAMTQVEDGVKLARAAGDAMRAISDGTQQAVRSVNGIYTALSEQSQASAEIATNVEQIAQMSEENSAATQQAYETARQLRELAAETRTAVRVFSL
ncbi:methyl-accepting chemotaxis protein [Thauera sp. ZXT1-4]|uniref:methyl-accepting chemotaxis protein n=1 Tax=Thauera sp. ZXT1-4 TaxID=3460294 RepID=UPI004040B1AE